MKKPDEFKHVYLLYAPKLTRFACEYVVEIEDAENIVQDVFTLLWEHWAVYGAHDNLPAFLFLTVKNRCIDFLRVRSRVETWDSKQHEEYCLLLRHNLSALDELPVALSREEDIAAIIREALETLPPRCREIFIKNKLRGKKQAEIARELNISINTVESQMAIAYQKLRVALQTSFPLLLFLIL